MTRILADHERLIELIDEAHCTLSVLVQIAEPPADDELIDMAAHALRALDEAAVYLVNLRDKATSNEGGRAS